MPRIWAGAIRTKTGTVLVKATVTDPNPSQALRRAEKKVREKLAQETGIMASYMEGMGIVKIITTELPHD